MSQNETIVYEGKDIKSFPVLTDGETIWLTQDQMCRLFGRDQSVIARHISKIFKEGELDKNSVYAKFAYTAGDGKVYQVAHYNLDVVISVGYRVKSLEGTRFRIWATQQLRAILMSKLRMVERIDKLENRVAVLEDGVAQLAEAFSEPEPFLPENRELIGFKPMQKEGGNEKVSIAMILW